MGFYENIFKEHILLEFRHGKNNRDKLFETRGVVEGIDEIINVVVKTVKNKLTTDAYTNTLVISSFPELNGTIFSNLSLTLEVIKSSKSTYRGGIIQSESFPKDKNGNIVFCPKVDYVIHYRDKESIFKILSFGLGHELTHAYGFYMYYKKHGVIEPLDAIRKRKRYIDGEELHKYRNAIEDLHYTLSKIELNAYTAQLRQEIEANNPENISDSKSAFDKIKETESYRNCFLYVKGEIEIILKWLNDPSLGAELLKVTNIVAKKNFTTTNQVKKYYLGRWNKWSKAYMVKASKIVYDIFSKYGAFYYEDDSKMSNPQSLKG